MAISAPVHKITPYATSTAATDHATASWSPTAGVPYALYVLTGRTDGAATVPAGVSGNGITWGAPHRSQAITNGNLMGALYVGSTNSPVNGPTALNFVSAHTVIAFVIELAGVDAASPIRQSKGILEANGATITLDSSVLSNNLSLAFISGNSQAQTYDASEPLIDFGTQPTAANPSVRAASAYALPAQQTLTFVASGIAQKTIIAAEFNAAAGSLGSWTYGREVRIGG